MSRWFSLLARIVASSQKSNLIIKLVIVEFLLDTIIIYFSILLGVDTKIVSLDVFQITPISSSLKWASFFTSGVSTSPLFSVIMQKLQSEQCSHLQIQYFAKEGIHLWRFVFIQSFQNFIFNCFSLILGFHSLAIVFGQASPA